MRLKPDLNDIRNSRSQLDLLITSIVLKSFRRVFDSKFRGDNDLFDECEKLHIKHTGKMDSLYGRVLTHESC